MGSHLQRLHAELKPVIDGATPSALQKAPPGKWTSEQILEHLYLSYVGTNRGLARCLDAGKPLATPATVAQRLKTFIVITLGHFPEGVKAPAVAVPRGVPPDEVRQGFFDEIEKMALALDECERRFGSSTKILTHPIMGPLTADEWRKLHWLHGCHHARQIRERINL